MTLYVSKFQKDAPKETTEKIAELDFAFDAGKGCGVRGH
jgi:hypothetical protein